MGVRLEYDPTQLEYSSFEIGPVLPNAMSPGADKGTEPTYVEVTAASMGGSAQTEGGLLGTVLFSALSTFSGTTINVPLAQIRRSGRFETVMPDISLELESMPSPGFNDDGHVGFLDFLLFAEKYGSRRGDSIYDPRYDLDADSSIGFADFVVFAQVYGS